MGRRFQWIPSILMRSYIHWLLIGGFDNAEVTKNDMPLVVLSRQTHLRFTTTDISIQWVGIDINIMPPCFAFVIAAAEICSADFVIYLGKGSTVHSTDHLRMLRLLLHVNQKMLYK